MDHNTVRSRLGAYMDRELSTSDRAAVESHLADCPACGAELEALRKTSAIIRQLPLPQPAPALMSRLHAAIDNSTRRNLTNADRFVGMLSGIAACLAVAGGLMLFRPAAAAPVPTAWESLAVQLPDDTALSSASDNTETAIGQWMVSSLSSQGEP